MAKLKCNLGRILKERNITVVKLAKDINHRRPTINDLASHADINDKRIPASLIANICAYLQITPNDLFEVIEDDQ